MSNELLICDVAAPLAEDAGDVRFVNGRLRPVARVAMGATLPVSLCAHPTESRVLACSRGNGTSLLSIDPRNGNKMTVSETFQTDFHKDDASQDVCAFSPCGAWFVVRLLL
jgi:hypothetical protein